MIRRSKQDLGNSMIDGRKLAEGQDGNGDGSLKIVSIGRAPPFFVKDAAAAGRAMQFPMLGGVESVGERFKDV